MLLQSLKEYNRNPLSVVPQHLHCLVPILHRRSKCRNILGTSRRLAIGEKRLIVLLPSPSLIKLSGSAYAR